MKRIKSILAILLIAATALYAQGLELNPESSGNFKLYDSYGERIDNSTCLEEGGYIVVTDSDPVRFDSIYGDIVLSPHSLFAITSLDQDNPSIYLIDGAANFLIKQEYTLSIYTPTSRLITSAEGEFYVVTSSNEELFINLSENAAYVFDGISGKTTQLDALCFSSLLSGAIDEEIDKDTYELFSYFKLLDLSEPIPEKADLSVAAQHLLVPSLPVFNEVNTAFASPAVPMMNVEKVELISRPEAPRFVDRTVSDDEYIALDLQPIPDTPTLRKRDSVLLLDAPVVKVLESRIDESLQSPEVGAISDRGNILLPYQENKTELITGERKKNSFSLDFLLKMRAAADSGTGEHSLRSSIVPKLEYGSFLLQLNIDPNSIMSIAEKSAEEKTLPFYLSYGISFLEGLYYRSFDERFVVAIDKTTTLLGDSVGLFDGIVHDWDGVDEKLSLNLQTRGNILNWRLFSPDISFANYADSDPRLILGTDFKFNFAENLPFSLGFEMMADIPYMRAADTSLYPAAYIDIPFIDNNTASFGMRLAYILAIDGISMEDFSFSDMGILFSFPLVMRNDVNFNFGGMYQTGSIYYGRLSEYYVNDHSTNSKLALFLEGDILFDDIKLAVNSFVNFDTERMKFLTDESYIDFSLGFGIGNIDFIFGARKTNFLDFENFYRKSDLYAGIGADTGSLSSRMLFRFTDGKPQMVYEGSIAMIDLDNVEQKDSTRPVDLQFEMGFERLLDHELVFKFVPILGFGTASNNFSLRVPLMLRLSENSIGLSPIKGDEWWTMFQGRIDKRVLFDSITDIFSLIEGFNFGSDDSFIHMKASRIMRKNDILFDNYMPFQGLSMEAGLKFKNLSISAYVDDLESPKIFDLSIGIYPFDSDSSGLIISSPTEIILKSMDDLTIKSFPGMTLHVPFLEEKLQTNIFVYGEMTATYDENSDAPVTEIIYDFENGKFYGYLLGAEIKWDDPDTFRLGLSGGIHSGLLAPNMFNAFTAFNPDLSVSASAVDDEDQGNAGEAEEDVKNNTYWLVADFALYFKSFNMFGKYSVPDMAKMISRLDDYTRDILTLGIDFTLPNGVGMELNLSRQAFASSVGDIADDFFGYMNSNLTIYSASITKNYDNLSLKAEFKTGALWEKNEDTPVNAYHRVETVPSLTITTRIGF